MSNLKLNFVLLIYKDYLTNKGYSSVTVKRYMRDLGGFFLWLDTTKDKHDLRDITAEDIKEYYDYMKVEKKNGRNRYTENSIRAIMCTINSMFRYFSLNEHILTNPCDKLDIRFVKRRVLKEALSVEEINTLLDGITVKDALTLRDRCIYELLYGTGLRAGELCSLNVVDIDTNAGRLFVMKGKGKKERVIPLGNNVIFWLKKYMNNTRKIYLKKVKTVDNGKALFLTVKGLRINIDIVEKRLRRYSKSAKINSKVTPHILRHSFATHMLKGGASIKHVKEILGHNSIQTTVIYTHFNLDNLKLILKKYHPRENELYEEVDVKKYMKVFSDLV